MKQVNSFLNELRSWQVQGTFKVHLGLNQELFSHIFDQVGCCKCLAPKMPLNCVTSILFVCIFLLAACNTPGDTEPPAVIVERQENTPTPPPTATAIPPSPTATLTPTPAPPTLTPIPSDTPTPGPTNTPTATPLPQIRQITHGNCCTDIAWSDDSRQIRFVDQPDPGQPVGVWGVDVTVWGASPTLITERLGTYNNDRTLVAYPDQAKGLVIVENLVSGEQWEINTGGGRVSFTLDNRLLWTVFDSEVSWRARQVEIWLAEVDGSQAQLLTTLERGSPAAWFSDDELLIQTRIEDSDDVALSILSIKDGSIREFATIPAVRDGLLNRDRRYLLYTIRLEDDPAKNGIWLLDFESEAQEPELLPFFGAYRWRDNRRIIFVPFDPATTEHIFYEYDVVTKQSRRLSPADPLAGGLTIANNDWQVAPDGTKIGLVAMKEQQLDGIWVVEIGQPGE